MLLRKKGEGSSHEKLEELAQECSSDSEGWRERRKEIWIKAS